MDIRICKVEYREIEPLRDLYRQEARGQIVKDSILRRGLADPYMICSDGRVVGYGGLWNTYHVGRVMEFYVLPHQRQLARSLYKQFLSVSDASEISAQTNLPLELSMLYDFAVDIRVENILFEDVLTTHLQLTGEFRKLTPEERASNSDADWGIDVAGQIVASGGYLTHYNPPYGDIYMEVVESYRKNGYGSYLVQELKRICYEAGKKPAARCNVDNVASRRTLEKAGLLPCGRLLAGTVAKSYL